MSSLNSPVLAFSGRRLIPPEPTEGNGGAPAGFVDLPATRFLPAEVRLVRAFVIGLDGFRIIHVCPVLPVLIVPVNLPWQVRAPDLENAHD